MSVIGETGKDKLTELVKVMEDSKTVNMVYRADDPCVGMGLTQDLDRYKLFLADTGLFVTLAFWDKDYTENEIYNKLLNGKLSANLGYVYENLVAQMLVAAGNRLFYYTWKKDEKHNYEIDFLISRGAKICPIEVKSSGTKSHVSIDRFNEKFKELRFRASSTFRWITCRVCPFWQTTSMKNSRSALRVRISSPRKTTMRRTDQKMSLFLFA